MARKYYDEDEDEYVEGEWLKSSPRELQDDDFLAGVRKDHPRSHGPNTQRRRFVFRFKPEIRIRMGDRGAGHRSGPVTPPDKGRFSFSELEKKHLLFATLMLIAAFIIFFHGGLYAGLNNIFVWPHFLYILVAALVAVLTGFLTHEIGHKFMAQRYGYWAEFRYSKSGLFLALILSLFRFIIAAPGAVMIYGKLTKKENGIISLSGPAVNAAWATLFIAAFFLIGIINVPPAGPDDIPGIGIDNSPNSGEPGSEFRFNITVTENINAEKVYVNFAHGDTGGNFSLAKSNQGYWYGTIKLDETSGKLRYTIYVEDQEGGYNVSSVRRVQIGKSLGWELVEIVVFYGFFINTIFAAFNLLPIRFLGLDGYKIADWNFVVYGAFVGITALFISLTAFGTTVATFYALICIGVALWRRFG